MPVKKVISQVSKQAIDKAVTKSTGIGNPINNGKSFQDILNNVQSGRDFAAQLGIGNSSILQTDSMQSIQAKGIDFQPEADAFGIGKPDTGQTLMDLLGDVNKGQVQMDSLVNTVLYGDKKLSNQELIIVQAHVYHFAQMTELTVKVAEQGVSSVKAVLNTQVQ